jgi:hypothetical protein
VNNKFVIYISIGVWVLSILVVFATQGNDTADAIVLIISFWLMFLGWRLNRERGRL